MPRMHFTDNSTNHSAKSAVEKDSGSLHKNRAERYTAGDRRLLLDLARRVVQAGVSGETFNKPVISDTHLALNSPAASFVTLKLNNQLRGCIGNLEANSSLIDSVLRNSYLAAFKDHRFEPVRADELDGLSYEISILTPAEPLLVSSEAELLKKLRPNVDGLIFEARGHKATFLPAVWEQLKEPELFLSHLRQKAGLASDYWSDDVKCFVYQAIKISEKDNDQG